MSDQRIQYDEEMVGAGHPTKSDTLNRLALIEANSEGKGKYRYFTKQASDPSTATDEGVLYAKEDSGDLKLYFRQPSDGEVVEVGGNGEVLMRGYTTVSTTGSGETVVNVDVSAAGIASLSEVVEVFLGCAYNAYGANSGGCVVRLTSTTNLQIRVGHINSGYVWVTWEIRKARGTVTRGYTAVTTSTSGYSRTTVTVSVDDLSKAEVTYNGRAHQSSNIAYNMPGHVHLNSTSQLYVEMSAYASAVTMNVAWAMDDYS